MTRRGETQKKTPHQQHQVLRFVDAFESIMSFQMNQQHRKEDVDAMLAISPPEMRSLMFLGRFGPTVMTEFAKGIGVPLSTATRIVNRLLKKGLAVRRRSDLDRRVVEIDLSPDAYQHKNRFMAKRLVITQQLLAPLSSPETETLLTLMETMVRLTALSSNEPSA
jgi:DNA-binding MarR family transcriptional regulator